ncbi:type I-D CRISPR-associated protein Cas5/Csc1 [Heliorestis convoluta]|uniref:Type I-D CRISPR-associated protein Cas5/Csc1 n=1 Tax=Heliorestis convoluta TaxID=356322 RepID=A0A5Q2N3T5_9FIRM|nr:type I-D CRISPR-associated protein Cas5/Csc1 [Heliorestis convoluta]QGG48991.1 type I-D CRISPR-associated protein Cas5/Csc1 [Heliorestis convoluta]
MPIYRLELITAEPLFFATREFGRVYVTDAYLHNYALTYAFGLAASSYHQPDHVPRYQEHLEPLNEQGIYLTPAKPLQVSFASYTFKLADVRYRLQSEQLSVNIPSYGQCREIGPESRFISYAFTKARTTWPQWIRLGKWMSKVEVIAEEIEYEQKNGKFVSAHPLNVLDLPQQPSMFNLLNMPPVSLVTDAHLETDYYKLKGTGEEILLPAGMRYKFPEEKTTKKKVNKRNKRS